MKNINIILLIAVAGTAAFLYFNKSKVFICAKSLYTKQSRKYSEPLPTDNDVHRYIEQLRSHGMTDEDICNLDASGIIPE